MCWRAASRRSETRANIFFQRLTQRVHVCWPVAKCAAAGPASAKGSGEVGRSFAKAETRLSLVLLRCRVDYQLTRYDFSCAAQSDSGISWQPKRVDGSRRVESLQPRSGSPLSQSRLADLAYAAADQHT